MWGGGDPPASRVAFWFQMKTLSEMHISFFFRSPRQDEYMVIARLLLCDGVGGILNTAIMFFVPSAFSVVVLLVNIYGNRLICFTHSWFVCDAGKRKEATTKPPIESEVWVIWWSRRGGCIWIYHWLGVVYVYSSYTFRGKVNAVMDCKKVGADCGSIELLRFDLLVP